MHSLHNNYRTVISITVCILSTSSSLVFPWLVVVGGAGCTEEHLFTSYFCVVSCVPWLGLHTTFTEAYYLSWHLLLSKWSPIRWGLPIISNETITVFSENGGVLLLFGCIFWICSVLLVLVHIYFSCAAMHSYKRHTSCFNQNLFPKVKLDLYCI